MEDIPHNNQAFEKLNEKLLRKNQELAILGDIFSQIQSSLDLDFVLNKILGQLEQYFGFTHSMILLTGHGHFLKVVASHGYVEKGLGAKIEIGKGVIGTSAKRRQIIRVGNINLRMQYLQGAELMMKPENEIVIKMPGLQNPKSQVAIPLLKQDELIGVLCVESDKLNIFKEEDEYIIHLIANQVALVIQQAKMYEAEKQRYHEIEEINHKLSDLTQTQQNTLSLFMRYVPEAVVKKALRNRSDSIFEGVQQDVAVLFCDIRDFTPISEKLSPNEVVTLLNTYYARMNEVIRMHKGYITQFVGDEIFVIFGAPVPLVNYEEHAVRCAVGMIHQLGAINEELHAQLGVSIRVGIGIHSGPVVAGNLGCEDKLSYSVTGDTVNTAKRIESITKACPDSILISDVVYEKTSHLIDAKAWDPVEVKGKNDKLRVWEVVGLIN
ncbi:MAG: adenylate/guanylate cyclase domain-containing protein [Saprospiraceae bacterium]